MDHVYKSELQAFAMKRSMDLPVYAAEREGLPHAPRFRCKVTVCGQTFQSQEFCPTIKAAEHSVAKLALATLYTQNPEGVDVAYKNLLQEIAQKESSLLPVYATSRSGPSHAPTFISTVEIAEKVFRGEHAKTKKLAEMSAAKVAYMSIKYGHVNQAQPPSEPRENQEAENSNVKSSVQEISSPPIKKVTPDVPSKWVEVYEDDVVNAPADDQEKKISIASNPTNDGTTNANATAMKIDAASSAMPQIPTNNAPATESIESSIAVASLPMSSEIEKKLIMGTGFEKLPTGQRLVCRPWNPEMTLPQDAEMLFRDDRFIAYRLV